MVVSAPNVMPFEAESGADPLPVRAVGATWNVPPVMVTEPVKLLTAPKVMAVPEVICVWVLRLRVTVVPLILVTTLLV